MAAYSTLSVTTTAGTTTVQLGNLNSITIDTGGGPIGTPAGSTRTPHTFAGFLQFGWNNKDEAYAFSGKIYPQTQTGRVSGLSYSGGVITVTETGHAFTNVPTANLVSGAVRSKPVTDPAWTKTTNVTIDSNSHLVIDGGMPAAYLTIPLSGISSISLTEAA